MRSSGWERWGSYSGIVSAILLVIGVGLVTSSNPSSSDSDQQVITFFTDNSHKAAGFFGAYLLAIGGVLFLVFITALRRAMEEGRPATIGGGQLVFVCGVMFVAMLFVFGALSAAVPAALALDTVDGVDPAIARFLPQAGFGALLVFGSFAAIGMIVSTSVHSLKTSFLPRWYAWLGFVAAIALVFAAAFVPVIALPIWILLTSVLLLGRHPGATAESMPSPEPARAVEAPAPVDDDAAEDDDDPVANVVPAGAATPTSES